MKNRPDAPCCRWPGLQWRLVPFDQKQEAVREGLDLVPSGNHDLSDLFHPPFSNVKSTIPADAQPSAAKPPATTVRAKSLSQRRLWLDAAGQEVGLGRGGRWKRLND